MKKLCAGIGILFSLLLGACTTPGSIIHRDIAADINDKLNKWFCGDGTEVTDRACATAYQNVQLRQLRAHLVVAMFARYGAARLPEYSQDLANDASKLLARIEEAEAELLVTREVKGDLADLGNAADKTERAALYPIDKIDALIAIVGVADAATRPTRKNLFGLMVVTSNVERIAAAPELLGNALRDVLYLGGYVQSMKEMRALLVPPGKGDLRRAWTVIDGDLAASCDTLQRYAKVSAHRCIPPAQPRS